MQELVLFLPLSSLHNCCFPDCCLQRLGSKQSWDASPLAQQRFFTLQIMPAKTCLFLLLIKRNKNENNKSVLVVFAQEF